MGSSNRRSSLDIQREGSHEPRVKRVPKFVCEALQWRRLSHEMRFEASSNVERSNFGKEHSHGEMPPTPDRRQFDSDVFARSPTANECDPLTLPVGQGFQLSDCCVQFAPAQNAMRCAGKITR